MCELLDFLALVTMCTAAIYFGLVGPIWVGLAASGRIGITEVRYYSCQYGLRPSDTLCVARVQISLLANFFLLLLLLLCHKKINFFADARLSCSSQYLARMRSHTPFRTCPVCRAQL